MSATNFLPDIVLGLTDARAAAAALATAAAARKEAREAAARVDPKWKTAAPRALRELLQQARGEQAAVGTGLSRTVGPQQQFMAAAEQQWVAERKLSSLGRRDDRAAHALAARGHDLAGLSARVERMRAQLHRPPSPKPSPRSALFKQVPSERRVAHELTRRHHRVLGHALREDGAAASPPADDATTNNDTTSAEDSAWAAAAAAPRTVGAYPGRLLPPPVPEATAECPLCGASFEPFDLDAHFVGCYETHGASAAEVALAERRFEVPAIVPSPPTELECVRSTCDTVEFRWRRPVFVGFAQHPPFDYMLTYHIPADPDPDAAEDAPPPPPRKVTMSTSRWCYADPVAHRGFALTGLRGGTEYGPVTVAVRSAAGVSAESNIVLAAATAPVVPPSRPELLELTGFTYSTFALRWTAPFTGGGAVVDNYEVCFKTMTTRDTIDDLEDQFEEKRFAVKTVRSGELGAGRGRRISRGSASRRAVFRRVVAVPKPTPS